MQNYFREIPDFDTNGRILIPFAVSSVLACVGRIGSGMITLFAGLIIIVAALSYLQEYNSNESRRITQETAALYDRVT
jgi:hypothetical protein